MINGYCSLLLIRENFSWEKLLLHPCIAFSVAIFPEILVATKLILTRRVGLVNYMTDKIN